MAKTGITDLQEALGNPKRPDFASLPDPIREMLSKKKQTRKEMKALNKRIERLKQKEQERGSKPKRVKIELTRSLLGEESEPPLDWVCPRDQAEQAIRDKFISVRLVLTNTQATLTPCRGSSKGSIRGPHLHTPILLSGARARETPGSKSTCFASPNLNTSRLPTPTNRKM